jgi:hypothetical protein
MNEIDYDVLVEKLISKAAGMTAKAAPSTPTTYYGHGNGGLFSAPGLERPVFSAMILPTTGLADILPAYPVNTDNPYYGISRVSLRLPALKRWTSATMRQRLAFPKCVRTPLSLAIKAAPPVRCSSIVLGASTIAAISPTFNSWAIRGKRRGVLTSLL